MLFHHAFLETRWRFLVGLMLLPVSAAFIVFSYARIVAAAALMAPPQLGDTALGRQIAVALEMAKHFDTYVWSQWFQQNGAQLASFFAVLIGTGGLLSQGAGAQLFTLSLPVSRERLLGMRAAAGLSQVLVLTAVPALAIVLASPLVEQRFPPLDALAYAVCGFAGCAVFFSLAFLFSSMFGNVWAPVVLTLCTGAALSMLDRITSGAGGFSLLQMMHGESYVNGHGLPWLMLAVSALLSSALIYAGVRNMARQDF